MDVALSLTHACNLQCSYCYAGPKRSCAMTRETAARALDFAFSFGSQALQLGFFGGEPLLAWDLLRWSTERAECLASRASVRLSPTVTTNATLLDRERLLWLREHAFYLGLSIDGDRAMHEATRPRFDGGSSFDACLRGLELALESFPEAEVIAVLDPANISRCVEGVRFLVEEKGVRRITLNPNFHASWGEAALARWREAFQNLGRFYLERFRAGHPLYLSFIDSKIITGLKGGYECRDRCGFGEREIAVAPSGRLYPCERLIGADIDTTMSIGDVFAGFDAERRGRVLGRRRNVNTECLVCGYRPRCMNWCCCVNYARTGLIDETDGLVCFHEQVSIEVADSVGDQLFAERDPAFMERFYRESEPLAGRQEKRPR